MDFTLSEEQEALSELAGRILTDHLTPERLTEVENGTEWFDREVWSELAQADLLGVCLPESVGGGGYGFLEACLLLERVGRSVAPIPFYATVVLGALPIAEFGSAEQQQRWLAPVVSGDAVLTAALSEVGAGPRAPALRAEARDDGWSLTGSKTAVPAAHVAAAILVPARLHGEGDDGGVGVFIVPTNALGLTVERQDTFNHEPQFHLDLDGVTVGSDARLGSIERGQEIVDWMVDRATVGLCAMAAGVSEAGLRTTAAYSTERQQFDRPIATFQAVGQRLADAYIDNEAIRLTMLQAATQLAEGRAADNEVAVAKYWASIGGSRVGHAGLHVHGGISIDLDYPIHRYFLWSKHLELTLGSATEQLAILGKLLAV